MVNRTFPFRLHAMLDQLYELDVHGESRIISWTPSGKSFKIHNVDLFTSHILPKYFPKQSHYKSFKRQLQYYGFSNFGWEHFGHPFFLRRQRDLVAHLRHKKSSKRNQQDVAQTSCPLPPADPLEKLLKNSEANKVTESLLKLQRRVSSPTLSVPSQANPAIKLHSDLFSLAPAPPATIQPQLNQNNVLDLILACSLPASLTPRLARVQASDLLTLDKQQQQQSEAQDLLCRSNRLAELQLRLALANTSQRPNIYNMQSYNS